MSPELLLVSDSNPSAFPLNIFASARVAADAEEIKFVARIPPCSGVLFARSFKIERESRLNHNLGKQADCNRPYKSAL
jgi:hypothetical protein